MSSNNLNLTSNGAAASSSSSFDHLLIQSLMSRLQLRPPYLDTNSFLSQNLDDFLLPSGSDSDSDGISLDAGDNNEELKRRKLISREESKLEREIIRIINSGNGDETLKANSGQSVSIGDHNICVGVHEEEGSEYRVWEWHGHIMLFDEEDGYSAEYIYGNYFERVLEKKQRKHKDDDEEEEEEEDSSKVKGEGNSGLKNLIGDDKGSNGDGVTRVVHRNSLNHAGSVAVTK